MSSSTFYASTSTGPSNASSSSSSSGIPLLPPLRCPLCPIHVHFPHDLALEAHLAQIHLGLRPFKCLQCPPAVGVANVDSTTFPTEWAFLDHLAYTHGQYSGQSLLQIDLELVNKRRQIQRLITCAILTRESSRMVGGEQQQMTQQMNNANTDISHFGQGSSSGIESGNLAQTSSTVEENGKRVEVKIEVEEEETMETINNVGNHQVKENGIKLECSTEGNESAEQDQNDGPTPEHLPNEQPCLSAAELEAAEILRTAAFKLSQSLLNRNRQQMEMTGGTMMEWKDKGNDGHQILEEEGNALNEYVQNQQNENGGSQNDYSAGEEDEHWIGQQHRKKKLSKKRRQNSENGGGMKKKGMEKKMISEEEEKQIHQFVANLLKKEEKRRAEMKKEEEAKKRRRTTSENK